MPNPGGSRVAALTAMTTSSLGWQHGTRRSRIAFRDEQANTGVITEGRRDAAGAAFDPRLVEHPVRVSLHARGPPDLFGEVIRNSPPSEHTGQGDAEQVRVDRLVFFTGPRGRRSVSFTAE